tara:strand:+ start:390 stop:722 length:333 start_codon:yes stop_codon:yes gene_type:complete
MEENKNMQLFMGLCTSLVSQAWMQLGKIKNPMNDTIDIDLDGASLTIDMLAMLKEKTKGNISDDESKILDQSISELKMNFVMSKEKEEKLEETSEEKPKEDSKEIDEEEK